MTAFNGEVEYSAGSPEVLAEMEMNQQAYDLIRNEMEKEHWGKTVVFSHGKKIAVFHDERDAYSIASEKFGPGRFSLHLVGERPTDIGYHAIFLTPGD